MSSATAEQSSKRDAIIALAYRGFGACGFHETGVDKVLADSGISKRTVYKYFRSKEELIAAAIAYYQHKTFTALQAEIDARATDAREKLLAIFDIKSEELAQDGYSGCFAINAGLAYEGRNAEIRAACKTFLNAVEDFIQTLCREAGCKNPAVTAMQIALLFDGTILHGQTHGNPAAAQAAREAVRALVT